MNKYFNHYLYNHNFVSVLLKVVNDGEKLRIYTSLNPYKSTQSARTWNIALRQQLLEYYSDGKFECALCGYDNRNALVIDHILGGGQKQLREIFNGDVGCFYRWLLRYKPSGYRILCHNCNHLERLKNGKKEKSI